MQKLSARFWVDAYLARLRQLAIPAYVVAHGDDMAGAVLVKQNPLNGRAKCYQWSFELLTGERAWVVLAEGSEAEVDAAIARQRGFDPDVWVIEVEDRDGRHLLHDPGFGG